MYFGNLLSKESILFVFFLYSLKERCNVASIQQLYILLQRVANSILIPFLPSVLDVIPAKIAYSGNYNVGGGANEKILIRGNLNLLRP